MARGAGVCTLRVQPPGCDCGGRRFLVLCIGLVQCISCGREWLDFPGGPSVTMAQQPRIRLPGE
jgi:hypothetical protein